MNKYKGMTLEALKKELKAIEKYCKGWESTTDGSHGMALSHAGWDKVYQEIKERDSEQSIQ